VPGGCGAAQRRISSKSSFMLCAVERLAVLEAHPRAELELQGLLVEPVGGLGEREVRPPVLVDPDRLLHRVPRDEEPVERRRCHLLSGWAGQGVEQRQRCALREHGHGQRPDAMASSSVIQPATCQRRNEPHGDRSTTDLSVPPAYLPAE
jgi:hypothetical protein